jgi:hypothetical protein
MAALLPSRQVFLSTLKPTRLAKVPECCNGNTTCSICLGDLADKAKKGASERAVILHGTHTFGELCIREWLEDNDSCPTCRAKIHSGADKDHGRLVSDLIAQTRLLMRRCPTLDRPIVDLEVFKLFERLMDGRMAVTSALLTAQLEASMSSLWTWRSDWWERNPLCLSLPEFASYTRGASLRAEELDVTLVVREERFLDLLDSMVNAGLSQGLTSTAHDYPLHVGAHPLFRTMQDVISRRMRKDQGKEMTVSTLAIIFRESLESDPRTRGVLTGEREDLPKGFQFYWEDLIVVFLQALIEEQHEK